MERKRRKKNVNKSVTNGMKTTMFFFSLSCAPHPRIIPTYKMNCDPIEIIKANKEKERTKDRQRYERKNFLERKNDILKKFACSDGPTICLHTRFTVFVRITFLSALLLV